MANIKYTITMLREIINADMEVETDEECLKAVRQEITYDPSFVLDYVMEVDSDKIEVELVE